MQSLRQADKNNSPVALSCGVSNTIPKELENLPYIAPKDFSIGLMMQNECKPSDLCRPDKIIPNRNISRVTFNGNSYSHLYPYNGLKQDIGYTGNCLCNQFIQSP